MENGNLFVLAPDASPKPTLALERGQKLTFTVRGKASVKAGTWQGRLAIGSAAADGKIVAGTLQLDVGPVTVR